MSPTLLSPQVFIQEVDQTIYNSGAIGPTGAIVLRNSYKGREEDTILVSSENEFITKFGKPNNYNYKDMFSAIAFLKDSNNLYCTRVLPADATFAGLMANTDSTETSGVSAEFHPLPYATAPILAGTAGNIEDPDLYPESEHASAMTGESVMWVISKDRGDCGNNLRIAVCNKTSYDAIKNKEHEYTGWATYSAIYGVDAPLDSLKEFIVVIQELGQGNTDVAGNWTTVEWWNVSTQLGKTSDLGQNMYVESVINTNSKYIRVAFNDSYNDTELTYFSTYDWQRLGGGRINETAVDSTTAAVVTATEVTNTLVNAAYDLYANAETVDIDVLIESDKTDDIVDPNGVKSHLVDIASTRKDCMAIIDCLYANVVNSAGSEETNLRAWMVDWKDGEYGDIINSSYGAIYANWLDIYDKYNGKYRWMPASGYVASVFAKCQTTDQYWSTPAGFARGQISGVRRLAWNPTLEQRDGIYKYNFNPIVSFSGQGKVVYGHKTLLDKYSAFNRINVRRLFISIESDIGSVARKYLFEPNTSYNRGLLVGEMKTVLDYAQAHDGIDMYRVVCDDTNNTEERISRNELWADIFVKPVFAVDYILITFVATKSTTNFTETSIA